jgi:hypothetical protein
VPEGLAKPQSAAALIFKLLLPFPLGACLTSAPSTMDSIIESRELQIERKLFSIDLRENGRGKFLRITEDSQGHRNVIIVPMSGVDDFADAIDDVLASEPAAQE